jgi:hypothetical protein
VESTLAAERPIPAASPQTRRWSAFLSPSLTDVLFLTMLFWLFIGEPTGWDRLLWDGDVALHTRVGDFVLDHGYVPTTDPFSFTKPGERFFALQWLTGVVFAELNRLTGLKGIVLLCGAMIALYLTLLARDMVRRGSNGLIAVLLVMFAANASAIHYHARPHLFTLLFLVLTAALIASDRKSPSWRIWLVVPIMLLWANMHSGFPAGLALLGLLVAGSVLSRDWNAVRRYGAVLAAAAAAAVVNPNGVSLYFHILKFLNNPWAMDNINEYQSPVFRSEGMYCYMAILFLGLAVLGRYVAKKQWTECLWILFFAAGSLTSARHIPLFVVIALPLIGVALTELWNDLTAGETKTSVLGVLADLSVKATGNLRPAGVWIAIVIVGVSLFGAGAGWPKDLSRKFFPTDIVHKFLPQILQARVFTSDQWGDYLLWTGYPQQKVFLDGRSDLYSAGVGPDYITIVAAAPHWREALARYNVNMILLPPQTPVVEPLVADPSWTVLARDEQAILLSRKP